MQIFQQGLDYCQTLRNSAKHSFFNFTNDNWEQVHLFAGSIVFLCRNPSLNRGAYFDRTFEEYKNGFAANGNLKKS